MSNEIPGELPPFAAEVVTRRTQAGISQRRLAEIAGISAASVRRIEAGWETKTIRGERVTAKVVPGIEILAKIAEALDWSPNEAAQVAGYPEQTIRALDAPPEPPREIAVLWPYLTSRQQELVVDVVKEFAARTKVDHRVKEDI